jgi:hypothetical protein
VDFELIIFDCDGILVHGELLSRRCLASASAMLSVAARDGVIR